MALRDRVASLVQAGKNDQQIADELGVAIQTVIYRSGFIRVACSCSFGAGYRSETIGRMTLARYQTTAHRDGTAQTRVVGRGDCSPPCPNQHVAQSVVFSLRWKPETRRPGETKAKASVIRQPPID